MAACIPKYFMDASAKVERGWFCTKSKVLQLARRWREGDHHQEFKDSLRGEQQLDHMVGVGAHRYYGDGRYAPVCSVQPQALAPTNPSAVPAFALPGSEPAERERQSEEEERKCLETHGNRTTFRRSQETKSVYQPLERVCSSSMEREREIPDVFDVFAIGKSPLPVAKYWL